MFEAFSKPLKTKIERIALISDVALGFGSPDISAMIDGLCEHFGAEGLLLQPDEVTKPFIDLEFQSNVRSVRILSNLPSWLNSWRWHFFREAGRELNRFKPDIVIAVGPTGYGASLALKHKPSLVLYYMLEMVSENPVYKELHMRGKGHIDCFLVPEVERFGIDFSAVAWKKDVPFERMALSASIDYPRPMISKSADQRNGKFIYFGSLHRKDTLLDGMLTSELDDVEIDFAGRPLGSEADRAKIAPRIASTPGKSYLGQLVPGALMNALPNYNFSLVTWRPEGSVARWHLPATKLYHSILAGVPVIAVPNPLNCFFINKYGIGLLLEDATNKSIISGLKAANAMIGTHEYHAMVERCKNLAEGDFAWSRQIRKIANLIQTTLNIKAEKIAQRRFGAKPSKTTDLEAAQ